MNSKQTFQIILNIFFKFWTKIFGFKFFAYYSLKYLKSKFNKKNNLIKFLKSVDIPVITLDNPINNQNSVDKIKKYNPDLLVSILANQIFKYVISFDKITHLSVSISKPDIYGDTEEVGYKISSSEN